MLEAIIGLGAIALLLIVGFWWTRGGGGMPGRTRDPAREQLSKYTALGDRLPEPGAEEPASRENQVE